MVVREICPFSNLNVTNITGKEAVNLSHVFPTGWRKLSKANKAAVGIGLMIGLVRDRTFKEKAEV